MGEEESLVRVRLDDCFSYKVRPFRIGALA